MNGDFGNIPDELRDRAQWLLWDSGSDSPRRPHWRGNFGVSWNDPDDWHSFEEAVEAASERESWGIGYVFAESNDDYPRGIYGALDIDGCADPDTGPKEWLPSMQPFFDRGAYMEKSPSKEGIHVPLAGFEPPEWWSDAHFTDEEHEGVEAYGSKFFTFTGDVLGDNEGVADTGEWVEDWLAEAYQVITGEDPRDGDSAVETGGWDPETHSASGSPHTGLGIYDVLSRSEYPAGENAAHPFHASGTGKNFKVMPDGDSWRCWRHDTGGFAIALLGQKAGLMGCEDNFEDLSPTEQREVYDEARERGYDLPEPEKSEGRTKPPEFDVDAGDGGEAAVSLTGESIELSPVNVMAEAGLDPDDESLADLPDRESAFRVWSLIDRGRDEHLLATQPDGTIYHYEGGLWIDEGEQRLRELGRKALGPVYSKNVHTELIEQVRAAAPMRHDSMGAPRATVAVRNGLYHLDTGEVEPLKPNDYATFRADAEYRADAECPRFREFVRGVVREDDLDTLQEYAGYTLLHWAQPYKRAMLLLGPQDSGKSTFLNILKAILGGNDNVSAENLNSLVNERWGKASLFGKVANITNELETKTLDSVGLFKTLTGGGDTISAEFKGKDKFDFEPTAKQLFATNQVPPTKDTDDAFYSRWVFASFPESVPISEQVPDLDDELLEKERSGILNWMIEGYERLREQGGFSNDPMSGMKRERWEAYGDSIKRFKHNCLETTGDTGDAVAKSVAHSFYAVYCHEKIGSEVEGQRKFTSELKKDDKIGDSKRKLHPDDQRRKVYTGVKFHPDAIDALGFDPGAKLAELRDDGETEVEDEPDEASLSGFGGEA